MRQVDRKAIKARRKALPGKKPAEYILFSPLNKNFIERMECRSCGTVIRSLIESEKPVRIQRMHNQTLITKLAIPAETSSYQEITVEFDDGSAHVTAICRHCSVNLSNDMLEEIYVTDLEQFERDEDEGRGPSKWESLLARKPISYKVNK